MSKTFEQGKSEIAILAEHFGKNAQFYRSGEYREANARQELIDPMFMALGWDVRNENHIAPQYREVVSETSLEIEGHKKSPDYVFRVGQTSKFYAEAKKPSVSIKNDPLPAHQLRHYAWNAKLPLSVLTDFEEFAVYHCRIRPKVGDKAAIARVNFLTFEEYPDRWRELWDVFSRDAVWGGEFDRYAQTSLGKRGTSEVDAEFLKEIEGWRDTLARNIAIRNTKISIDELNEAVQLTIDRIIFLRMAEDRGIEPYEQLRKLADSENIYNRFIKGPCRKADEKYNSGLFDFTRDKLTPRLDIDDKVIEDILKRLYFPESPYNFRLMPVEILGNVYEQFLGKVIRLTEGHHAKIEEKPEVKKAGGVYYTPAYIVEYIVKNTVGALLAPNDVAAPLAAPDNSLDGTTVGAPLAAPDNSRGGKNKRAQQAAPLREFRILDMACGSGSFLLGAYKYLLDFYLKWYTENKPEKSPKAVWKQGEEWRLTIGEKKRILLTHIFGVDIDRQAVEVTKLSLLLKVLEGESDETLMKQQQLALWQDRALPYLDKNIKCGNSLIGTDYFTDRLIPDPIEMRRVNPFDWDREFPEAMKAGGFDCVIGNPPYGAYFNQSDINFLKLSFQTATLRGESYLLFTEKAVGLLKISGILGYIVPDTYLNLAFTKSLRDFLLRNSYINEIDLLPSKVFQGATVDTTLLFVQKSDLTEKFNANSVIVRVFSKKEKITSLDIPMKEFKVSTSSFFEQGAFCVQGDQKEFGIIFKIDSSHDSIASFAEMYSGIKAYEVGKGAPPQTETIRDAKPYTSNKKIGKDWSPFFDGKHIGRYQFLWQNNNWINYGKWLAAPREPMQFADEKILIRKIVGKTLLATYIAKTSYCNTLLFILKLKHNSPLPYLYFLGILNSSLVGWYYRKKFQITSDDTFPQIMIRDILQIPIPLSTDLKKKNIISLVEQMLELHRRKADGKGEADRSVYDRQIAATDGEIDRLVYELYGLTEDEIRIVEGGG